MERTLVLIKPDAVQRGYIGDIITRFEKKGLKMVAKSPSIPEHLFVARSSLSKELTAKIRSYLIDIEKSPDKQSILNSIKKDITNFLPVADQDYDPLRIIVKSLDL